MRGEHGRPRDVPAASGGIIPACAGSTALVVTVPLTLTGSSPHARGARRGANTTLVLSGDHPRMRGEHVARDLVHGAEGRIIPACAGSTSHESMRFSSIMGSSPHARGARTSPRASRRLGRDHPRMRGEHRCDDHQHRHRRGIIPACAGSTESPNPRQALTDGSSPHARGAHLTTCSIVRLIRKTYALVKVHSPCQLLEGPQSAIAQASYLPYFLAA